MIARIAVVTAAVLALTAAAAPARIVTAERTARACHPAELWSADPGRRPCSRVTVEEDGSGRLVLGTARRALARCFIPNPREERARFVIDCRHVRR